LVRAAEAVGAVEADSADADHDGIRDWLDCCPGTPQSTVTGLNGCSAAAANGSINLPGVTFANNSADLSENSRAVLIEAAAILMKHPTRKFLVTGYTDSVGTSQHNLDLSRRRAASVYGFLKAALEETAAPYPEIAFQGYGEASPVASNFTAYGRAANRRVVLRIVSGPQN
jgi:outer membrane protein OmpA-like peptidoglycan-associated protein